MPETSAVQIRAPLRMNTFAIRHIAAYFEVASAAVLNTAIFLQVAFQEPGCSYSGSPYRLHLEEKP